MWGDAGVGDRCGGVLVWGCRVMLAWGNVASKELLVLLKETFTLNVNYLSYSVIILIVFLVFYCPSLPTSQ